jgi:phage/plasmid-associated DNA primase
MFYPIMELKQLNETDIADAIYNCDYNNIKDWKAVVMSKTDTKLFIPLNGIWVEQKGLEEVRDLIKKFRIVIGNHVILSIQIMINKIDAIAKQTKDDEEELKFLHDRFKFFNLLIDRLGGKLQDAAIKQLIHRVSMETSYTDFRLENLDRAVGYLAFDDGVYSFKEKKLIPQKEALSLYLTRSVGYYYEDVLNVNQKDQDACRTFVEQILPDELVRMWFLKRLHNSFQGIVEKLIVFFYNKGGHNGKTKLFELLDRTLGEQLFCKCSKKLLNPDTSNNVSSNNEELMSIMGTLLAVYSEPDPNRPLNMSLLKDLSGGDPITGTRKYKSKEKFYAKALQIVLCNLIPAMDSIDKACFNRIRCVPGESEFVLKKEDVNEEEYRFLMDF